MDDLELNEFLLGSRDLKSEAVTSHIANCFITVDRVQVGKEMENRLT